MMSENHVNQVAQTLIEKQILTVTDGVVKTTSLQIADYFEKRHDNVLRDIQSLDCSKEFNALNFEGVKYTDEKGELRPMYNVTKDGFVFLVMGYRGEKAALFKEAYIQAFNLMQDKLAASNHDSSQATALEQEQFAFIKQALLTDRPLWQDIHRYRPVLMNEEIAKLLDMNLFQLQYHLSQMSRCGLLNDNQDLDVETKKIDFAATDPHALWRLEVIKPALFFPKGSHERAAAIDEIVSKTHKGVNGKECTVCDDTVYSYINKYEKEGLKGLARKKRDDRGLARSMVSRDWDQVFCGVIEDDQVEQIVEQLDSYIASLQNDDHLGWINTRRLAEAHLIDLTKAALPTSQLTVSQLGACKINRWRVERTKQNLQTQLR